MFKRIGNFYFGRDPGQALIPGSMFFNTHLRADVLDTATGAILRTFDLGSGVVTTAGVNLLAQDWNAAANNQTLKLAKFHDSGTGVAAAVIGDTALGTPTGGARVSGTQSNPASGQYRTVATISYGSSFAVTEWGLFTASSGVTLWDRRTFTSIPGDTSTSIQFTYTLTINAGG